LGYFSVLVCCTKKNLATLNSYVENNSLTCDTSPCSAQEIRS
jgi:hypothetical protein